MNHYLNLGIFVRKSRKQKLSVAQQLPLHLPAILMLMVFSDHKVAIFMFLTTGLKKLMTTYRAEVGTSGEESHISAVGKAKARIA